MISTPLGAELPSPATLSFNRPIRALLPQRGKEPININADREHYDALRTCQDKNTKGSSTCKDSEAVKCKDGCPVSHYLVEEVNDTDH